MYTSSRLALTTMSPAVVLPADAVFELEDTQERLAVSRSLLDVYGHAINRERKQAERAMLRGSSNYKRSPSTRHMGIAVALGILYVAARSIPRQDDETPGLPPGT